MAQVTHARGWSFDVERGPECLYVRPRHMRGEAADARWLADQVWSLLEQNLAHRVVLELTEIGPLDATLVEQIIDLSDRIRACDGLMRVCGLSRRNQQIFTAEGLESRASSYADREAAVMGWARPEKPR